MTPNNKQRKIDFLGIGAPRCGSTWIAECLFEHPEIIFPNKSSGETLHHLDKEMNFFSEALFRRSYSQKERYKKGINWYLNQFDWSNPSQKRGEYSVGYFADKKAAARIEKHFPDVKIIAVLRNPVKMVHSAYYHLKALVHTRVPKDFDSAVQKGEYNKLRLPWGLYAKNLERYYRRFPKENIHIVLLDDIKNNPQNVIENLYTFLKVDNTFQPTSLKRKKNTAVRTRFKFLKIGGYHLLKILENLKMKGTHNKLGRNRLLYSIYRKINLVSYKYPFLEGETKKILKNYFRNDIEKLEKLIQRDLSIWK